MSILGEENITVNIERYIKQYSKKVTCIKVKKYYQFYSFEYISKYDLSKDYFLVEIQFLFRQKKSSYGEYNTAQLLQIYQLIY
jgi:hypothetical protein